MLCLADEERRKDRQVSEDVVWIEWRMEIWSGLRVALRAESEPRLCQSPYENSHMESLPSHKRGYDMVSKVGRGLFTMTEQWTKWEVKLCADRVPLIFMSPYRI